MGSSLREFLGTSQIMTFGIVLLESYTHVNDYVLLPKTLDVRADSFLLKPASLVHIVQSYFRPYYKCGSSVGAFFFSSKSTYLLEASGIKRFFSSFSFCEQAPW